jgi:hypothetical protein
VRAQGPPSCLRRDWLLGLALILFVILAYTPVWKAGFLWDDETILTANPSIVGALGLKEIWTTPAAAQNLRKLVSCLRNNIAFVAIKMGRRCEGDAYGGNAILGRSSGHIPFRCI